jgi:hypothetical protein
MEFTVSSLVDRYKLSMSYITNYLATAAKATGTLDRIFLPADTPWDFSTSATNAKERRRTYKFDMDELFEFAEAIERAQTRIDKDLITILEDNIWLRREANEWYVRLRLGTARDDAQHAFFVEEFRRILGMLKPLSPPQAKQGPVPVQDSTITPNFFRLLELEKLPDISDILVSTSAKPRRSPKRTRPPKRTSSNRNTRSKTRIY